MERPEGFRLMALLLSFVTAALAVFSFVRGEYWYALPFLLWLHFYLSLAAVRRARKA